MKEQKPVDLGSGSHRKKPVRLKIGVVLLLIYVLMWVAAGIVPFLPLALATKGTIVAADLVAAEVVGLLGVVLVGKEAYQAAKTRLLRGRGRGRESSQ